MSASLPIDPAAIADLLASAAVRIVMPRFRALAKQDIRQKTRPDDLVTVADIECQAFLAEHLGKLLPQAVVVGEEDEDEDAFARIRSGLWCWLLDPLDGTHNFVHGRRGFTIMAALLHDGEARAGWIHDPLSGKTTIGVKGEGAIRAGKRLTVAPAGAVREMAGALYVGARRAPALRARINQVRASLGRQVFQRGAGAEYLALVTQRIHYAIFTRLLPWDHAAGSLIFREAGGYMCYLDGEPYRPDADRKLPVLLAPSAESWRELRDFFAPGA
jgi:fructose-1,6-bisphosphatase/inositol monophosphatase family enzyme